MYSPDAHKFKCGPWSSISSLLENKEFFSPNSELHFPKITRWFIFTLLCIQRTSDLEQCFPTFFHIMTYIRRKQKHLFGIQMRRPAVELGLRLPQTPAWSPWRLRTLMSQDIDTCATAHWLQSTGLLRVHLVHLIFFMRHNSLNCAYSYFLPDLSFLFTRAKSQRGHFPIN